jgi:hypothetical protein
MPLCDLAPLGLVSHATVEKASEPCYITSAKLMGRRQLRLKPSRVAAAYATCVSRSAIVAEARRRHRRRPEVLRGEGPTD